MIVDKRGKTMYVSVNDMSPKVVCPACSSPHKIRCNGTGPQNKPILTKLLQLLPSEHYIGGFAPFCHDLAYSLCAVGWALTVEYLGVIRTAVDKDSADLLYLDLMTAQVNRLAPPALRPIMRLNARRNYEAVHLAGDSSYSHRRTVS